MSSGKRRFAVRPGGCLVVEGAGLQASVQDADQPVSQPPECVAVSESPWLAARRRTRGRRARRSSDEEGPGHQGVDQPVVVDEPDGNDFFLAGGAGDGAGAAVVLAGLGGDVPAGVAPVSPTTVRPARRRTGASPDIQHSDALGHARPMNSSAAGNPWAWTDDQGSPPLPETRRTAPAEPPRFDTAMQVSELLHESEARPPTGTGGALAGDHSRPLSVL